MVTIAGISFLAQFPIEVENLVHKPLKFSASLFVYYVVVGAPFLLSGFTISVPFAAYPKEMGRLYFWDLAGAAAGCAFAVWFIEIFTVPGLVFSAAGLMLAGAGAVAWSGGRSGASARLFGAGALVFVMAAPLGLNRKAGLDYDTCHDPHSHSMTSVIAAQASPDWPYYRRIEARIAAPPELPGTSQ